MTDQDRSAETFRGTHNSSIKVALNFPPLRYLDNDAYVDANYTYIGVRETGKSIYFAMSKSETRALRDHLNLLLGEEEGLLNVFRPVVSAETTAAMSELAHQLDVFYTDELVDALSAHTAALNNFNK